MVEDVVDVQVFCWQGRVGLVLGLLLACCLGLLLWLGLLKNAVGHPFALWQAVTQHQFLVRF